ncbi:MAG: DEAD/DEAH box helicase [Phycisphaerales bacterium]|nr:MAG: DEAD/DEAH box helicase [Phycisphaerales bacterium]
MIVLHALWTDATFHLWGERRACNEKGKTRDNRTLDVLREGKASFVVGTDVLRQLAGDLWDSLLVSGARTSHLALRLPHSDGQLASGYCPANAQSELTNGDKLSLRTCRIDTLAFSPADAVDLLTALPTFEREDLHCGGSLRYWSKAANLVLESLAKHRFVPMIHRTGANRYRSYWRVVVNDQSSSDRLKALITSMPPVCRSMESEQTPVQASTLVENFLWTTVDALVRRCLEGDELAHSLQDRVDSRLAPQMGWLRALVGSEPTLTEEAGECAVVYNRVGQWVSRLESPPQQRSCRTCFHLHAPRPVDDESPEVPAPPWKLTLHVQALHDPSLIVNASSLADDASADPAILKRPFDNARPQLLEDLTRAARHFPSLIPCTEPDGPSECSLTLEEAYRFLRDAAPVLEAEGFAVWVPRWWRGDRAKLRMRLDIRPPGSGSPAETAKVGLDALVAYDWHVALGDEEISPEEMARLLEDNVPLVQIRGKWTEVQTSDVGTALRFLRDHRPGKMTVFEALRLSYLADDLDTGLPVAGIRAHGWIHDVLNATSIDETIEQTAQPDRFAGELRPYQRQGLSWLRFLSKHGLGACLADDMGLGKTIQMIALWLNEREEGDAPGPTLLVVPMSLVGNWQREIARFAPSLSVMVHHGLERLTGDAFVDEAADHDVVISTYGLAHRDLEHLAKVQWHRIALDEAQNVKNPAAKQSVAVRSLQAVQRVALTGTPVENRLSELWSIIDFLNPGYLGNASEFRRRFAVPIERHHDEDRSRRLRELIQPFILRRVKDDPAVAADLPEKHEMTVYCNLTAEQAALYEGIVKDMLGQIDQSGGIQRKGLILAAIVKLKQICNHPVQFLADNSSLAHRSGKCDRLVEMLDEVIAEDHHALVFTQFRQMGNLLKKHMQESLDREILYLHGGTAQRERDRLIDRFQTRSSDTPVLLLTLKAGGLGLNLTAANHVFHYDRWWNPAVENQATDRAHRVGQYRRVQVHRYVCLGTLEERIAAIIESKKALMERIVGSGEEWLTEMSTDQLRELFTLSREAVAEDW